MSTTAIELEWQGPFPLASFQSKEPPSIPDGSGLYVICCRIEQDYYAYNPGKAGGRDCKTHPTLSSRLAQKTSECSTGGWFLHDPNYVRQHRRLGPETYSPRNCAGSFDPKAARRWMSILYVFVAPYEAAGETLEHIERAIHQYFKAAKKRGAEFAQVYDERQERIPRGARGPLTIRSRFRGTPILGMDRDIHLRA